MEYFLHQVCSPLQKIRFRLGGRSMRKQFCLVLILTGLAATFDCPVLAQLAAQPLSIAQTTETVLSGNNWKLGSFEMDEGEKHGANVRQLVSRARRHIADSRRTPVSSDEQRRFLEAFIGAAQKGDLAGLEGLFAEDVVPYSDGGGLVRAARVPVSGRKRVATFIAAVASHFWKGVTLAWVETNGQAAVLMSRDGVPVALATVDASAQGIDQIMWIMRPSKLAAISKSGQRLGDVPGPAAA